jgi:protein subunit release factor B
MYSGHGMQHVHVLHSGFAATHSACGAACCLQAKQQEIEETQQQLADAQAALSDLQASFEPVSTPSAKQSCESTQRCCHCSVYASSRRVQQPADAACMFLQANPK